MKTYNSKWWCLSYPSDWECIPSRDDVRFVLKSDTNVTISSLRKQYGNVSIENINDYLSEDASKKLGDPVIFGLLQGFAYKLNSAEEIYVHHKSLMLIIIVNYKPTDHPEERSLIFQTLKNIALKNY